MIIYIDGYINLTYTFSLKLIFSNATCPKEIHVFCITLICYLAARCVSVGKLSQCKLRSLKPSAKCYRRTQKYKHNYFPIVFLHCVSLCHVSAAPPPAHWGDPDVSSGRKPPKHPTPGLLEPTGKTQQTPSQQQCNLFLPKLRMNNPIFDYLP